MTFGLRSIARALAASLESKSALLRCAVRVPQLVSVGGVSPSAPGVPAATLYRVALPELRPSSVVLRDVASASTTELPRSVLCPVFRTSRRTAAASKFQRMAQRFANQSSPASARNAGPFSSSVASVASVESRTEATSFIVFAPVAPALSRGVLH